MRSYKTFVRLFLPLSLFVAAAIGQITLPLTFRPLSLANETVGVLAIVSLANDISGGSGSYTLSLAPGSGPIPPGLTLDATDDEFTGIPTTPGTYAFTLMATDTSFPPQTASQNFTITVGVAPFAIVPATGSLTGGVVKAARYRAGLSATGGIPPYSWSFLNGTDLPASSGLTLQSMTVSGAPAITGTLLAAGTYSFTVQVTDSSPTPQSVSQTYTISVINPTLSPSSGLPTGISATSSAVWFTQVLNSEVGSIIPPGITPSGSSPPAEIPITNSAETNIILNGAMTTGPDGNLWIVDTSNFIYSVTPDGKSVTPIQLENPYINPVDPVYPNGITSGKDGGVWFTGSGNQPVTAGKQAYVGRISANGSNTVSLYPLPSNIISPIGIVPDPAGQYLWVLASVGSGSTAALIVGTIGVDGSLTPAAAVCPISSPCFIKDTNGTTVPPASTVNGGAGFTSPGPWIAVGSDGGIWFATGKYYGTGDGAMGRIAEDGSVLLFPTPGGQPESLALAPDQAIWYIALNVTATSLGRITSSGQATAFTLPSSSALATSPVLAGVALGPDGALWVTDHVNSVIYQIFPSLVLNCSPAISGTFLVGAAVNTTSCSAAGGSGHYTYTYNQSNLPAGVTVTANASGAVVTGTPTAPGSVTITANDTSSPPQQASQVFSFQAPPPVQLDCTFPATGAAGQPYSGTCAAAGGSPPYTYLAPKLPAGLTGTPGGDMNNSYSVSGTLSTNLYGTVSFTITAFDSATPPNASTPATVSINVSPVPLSLSCSSNTQAVLGRAFQQTCYGSGGVMPYPSFTATGLPAGLTINNAGVISGTPTALGSSSVSIVVNDSAGQIATQTINLPVVNPKLALLCNLPFNPTTASAISTTCTTSGGVSPYSYSVFAGNMPTGLTLNPATGLISGTPSAPGRATFTLLVTDSASPAATAQQKVSLFVHPTALTFLTTTFPAPTPPLPYAVNPSVEGGTPPYTFSISSGALPTGLVLDPSGTIYTKAGATSVASGPYSFTLQVKDQVNATATQNYAGTVASAPVAEVFNSYALPTGSGANGITVGPDSNLWFTTLDQAGGNLIGRITTAGVVTTIASANPLTLNNTGKFELAMGGDIAAGPDGQIWVAQRDGNTVGVVALDLSSQQSYIPPTPNSGPGQITAAPDGTLWFTETAASQIAHVGADGAVVEFPTVSPYSGPYAVAIGPYNFVTFTEPGPSVNKISVISQDGSTKLEFPIPTAASLPTSIVLGPDGAMWFTEFGVSQIGRMDFAGNIVEVPASSGPQAFTLSSAPQAIALGADGALYFTETFANKIGRVTIAGDFTEIQIPDVNSGPIGIVAGPDGSIWFTESNLSKISRMTFILAPTVSCTLPASPLPAGSAFSGTCTATQGTAPYQFSLSTATDSTPPPGVKLDPTSGAFSGTLTTAGTFTFTVLVTDSSLPAQIGRQTFTISVSPLPLSFTCDAGPALLYTAYAVPATGASYGCTAANGTPPYTYAITSGTLPPGLSFDPKTGNITGNVNTAAELGSYPLSIQVTDSGTPPMGASQQVTIIVEYGQVTAGGTGHPLFTLSTAPLSVAPGSNTPGLTLSVNELLLQAVSGTAVLTFNSSAQSTPSGYQDPALQFVDAKGNVLGAAYTFTFPPGVASITLPAIDAGTVAGTIDLTISTGSLFQTATTFRVIGNTAVEGGSVQFTNVTATGFDLEFVAVAPSRKATTATISFSPSSGDKIAGQQTFVFNVSAVSGAWFAGINSLKYGGMFSLTFPFVFDGPVSAIGSATVTLDGSQPATGNR